jgi:hypothetical protein
MRVAVAALSLLLGVPRVALAFAHGDVPNVSSDKRGHEPPKEAAKAEDRQGGAYRPPPRPKASWWDNGGHEQQNDVYTRHSSPAGSGANAKPRADSSKVQHLEGGATVSDVATPVRRKSSRPVSE